MQRPRVLNVPAGTVHALATEIQQSSDTTYRVYDYDRPGLDGRPRALPVEHVLAVTRYGDLPAVRHAGEPPVNGWAPS